MPKVVLNILIPPFAACRYGCAGCCAAPIGVFWLAGIVGIIYGLLGGPLELHMADWKTVALGAGLWIIAAVWAALTIRGASADKCANKSSTICNKILPSEDEPDPLEEVRKAKV